MSREKVEKILAIAINPGAIEAEAIAALLRAREIVKGNPALAHLAKAPDSLEPATIPDHSLGNWLTNIAPFWLPIVVHSLSAQAYGLGLKSPVAFDFQATPTALDRRCDGSAQNCAAFQKHLDWLLEHVNSQPRNP